MNQMLKSYTERQKTWIMMDRSDKNKPKFRLGKGDQVSAAHAIHLPARWKNRKLKLKLHVKNENVQFLIGIQAISKLGLVFDLKQMKMSIGDTCEIRKQSESGQAVWKSSILDSETAVRELDVFLISDSEREQKMK